MSGLWGKMDKETKIILKYCGVGYEVGVWIAGEKSSIRRFFDNESQAMDEVDRIKKGLVLSSDAFENYCEVVQGRKMMLKKLVQKYWFYKFRLQRWVRQHNILRWIRKRWTIARQDKIARRLINNCAGCGPKTSEEKRDDILGRLGSDVEHFEHFSQETDPMENNKEISPDSVVVPESQPRK